MHFTSVKAGSLHRAKRRSGWRDPECQRPPSLASLHLHYIVKAPGFRTLVTEIFPDDDPYLDEDTVFGVREDLVMTYVEQPAGSFPSEGYVLSGKVDGSCCSRISIWSLCAREPEAAPAFSRLTGSSSRGAEDGRLVP